MCVRKPTHVQRLNIALSEPELTIVLEKLGLTQNRSLEEDLTLQTAVMSYGGNGKTISLPPKKAFLADPAQKKSTSQSTPDFSRMSPEERLEYHQTRLNRMFGQ